MKLVKIKMSNAFANKAGVFNITSIYRSLEVIQIFHLDRFNLVSLQKIVLKSQDQTRLNDLPKPNFHLQYPGVQYCEVLDQNANEVLCLVKQHWSSGFWPDHLSGDWNIIPPIFVDADFTVSTILVESADHLPLVLEGLFQFQSYEILSMSNVDKEIQNLGRPSLHLTKRQREIISYASQRGYFEIPKKISTMELADHFYMSHAGISNHLQRAEKRIMKFLFG